jgi:hypothetical protein
MKRKLILLIILLGVIYQLQAQKTVRNAQITLFGYDYSFSSAFMDSFSKLSPNFTFKGTGKQNSAEVILARNIYVVVKEQLSKVYNLYALPENSFQKDVKYDENGYPQLLIQKAIKEGTTRFYFKVIASIDNVPVTDLPKECPNGVYPRVNICIKIYNKFGYEPVKVMEGSYYPTKPYAFTPDKLNGLELTKQEEETETPGSVRNLISEAVYRAVNN